jgi:hypothetical protein
LQRFSARSGTDLPPAAVLQIEKDVRQFLGDGRQALDFPPTLNNYQVRGSQWPQ